MKAEHYKVEKKEILDTKVTITTYQIGEKFFCHISNEDPGATVARSEAGSKEEAIRQAMAKAADRLRR